MATCSKRRVTEEDLVKDDLKKSRVEDSKVENADGRVAEGDEPQASRSDEGKTEVEEEGKEGEAAAKEFIIGETLCFDSAWMHEKQYQKTGLLLPLRTLR